MFERSTSFFVEQRMLQLGEASWEGTVCRAAAATSE